MLRPPIGNNDLTKVQEY